MASDKLKKFCKFILESILSSLTRIINQFSYIIILGTIIYLFVNFLYGANISLLLKEFAIKELGIDTNSYFGRKIDEGFYAITPYGTFDRNKMIEKTDSYINRFNVGIVDREFKDISKYIEQEDLRIYKNFYLDLKQFHTDLVFNIYNYNKDTALKDLYKIILKYKCSIEKANQNFFQSNAPQSLKDNFLKEKLSDKIKDLLVETMVYTKSISIDEFNDYKVKNKDFATDKELWNKMLFNYYIELIPILRGELCFDNYVKMKNKLD
ncbi:MAG: hypothetical protein EOL97_13300 [Spirochaetia bacterium]|nr:hypothetical protein [Spirochaetia bacterium]